MLRVATDDLRPAGRRSVPADDGTERVRRELRAHHAPCVVAIATFDGVHAGHRALLAATAELARVRGLRATAVTLAPRPDVALRPDRALPDLCTLDERVGLLGAHGADAVVILPFDAAVAAIPGERFVDLLRKELGMRALCAGSDFRVGCGGRTDVPALRRLGVDVTIVPFVRGHDGEKVSSSVLRGEAFAPGAARPA